jgi:hypothetical protein
MADYTKGPWHYQQESDAYPLISTHNATNTPDGLTQTFAGNTLNCTAAAGCSVQFQSAEIYTVSGNILHNTRIDAIGTHISQIIITGNDFAFDVAAPHGIQATTSAGSPLSTTGSVLIRNNSILSSATQTSGAQAILASGADGNNASNIRIEGNITGGVHAFPVGLECDAASSNAGVPTFCTILNNSGGNVVTNNGSSGAPVKVNSINTQQFVSASGCAITAGSDREQLPNRDDIRYS